MRLGHEPALLMEYDSGRAGVFEPLDILPDDEVEVAKAVWG